MMTQEILAAGGGELMEEQLQLESDEDDLIFGEERRSALSSIADDISHLTGLSVKCDNNCITIGGEPVHINGDYVEDGIGSDVDEITRDILVSATNGFMMRIGWMLAY